MIGRFGTARPARYMYCHRPKEHSGLELWVLPVNNRAIPRPITGRRQQDLARQMLAKEVTKTVREAKGRYA